MFTLLGVTLLILRAFLLFSYFSYHVSSLCVCSRYVHLLSFLCFFFFSLSLFLMLLLFNSFFFNHLHLFFFSFLKKSPFLICSPLFVKLFLFYLHCCFAFFLVVLFNRVRSNKINCRLFFSGRKTTCSIPPRTYLLNFCHLM